LPDVITSLFDDYSALELFLFYCIYVMSISAH